MTYQVIERAYGAVLGVYATPEEAEEKAIAADALGIPFVHVVPVPDDSGRTSE